MNKYHNSFHTYRRWVNSPIRRRETGESNTLRNQLLNYEPSIHSVVEYMTVFLSFVHCKNANLLYILITITSCSPLKVKREMVPTNKAKSLFHQKMFVSLDNFCVLIYNILQIKKVVNSCSLVAAKTIFSLCLLYPFVQQNLIISYTK